MDNELFKLCKQVYEKTGWGDTLQFYDLYLGGGCEIETVGGWESEGAAYSFDSRYNIPLYTSDYLLEKLPPVTELHRYTKFYSARHINVKRLTKEPVMFEADTPLKALLKLTLALPDECISKGVHE